MREFESALGLGLAGLVWLSLLPFFLFGLAIPYAVLRIREGKGNEREPQIGLKAGLHYFTSAGILLALLGLTIIFVDLFTREERKPFVPPGGVQPAPQVPQRDGDSPTIRVGLAVLVTGVLCTLLHALLLLNTNDRRAPMVRRTFTGTRFAIAGLIVLFSILSLLIVLFQKNVEFKTIKPILAVLLVWAPAWLVHLVLLIFGTPRYPDASNRMVMEDDR